MPGRYSVHLTTIIKEQRLSVLHSSADLDTRVLTLAEVNRPALQLAGFYNYFDPKRLQVIGRVESNYLEQKSPDERRACFEEFMKFDISAIVLCHGAAVFPECLEMAEKYDRNLFTSKEATSDFMASVIMSLHTHLAPRTTMHGVLCEVHGEGVLLTGDSGIGKSETALELIKRGHKLIADDAVDIKRIGGNRLIGTAPEMIRYYMELRGIGVVDVRHLFGVGAVKPECEINLVVNLEVWDDNKAYDRLGLTNESVDILDVTVPAVTIPVRPGRNLAVILELAAMNNRQKKMGYNAAETLAANHDTAIDNANI